MTLPDVTIAIRPDVPFATVGTAVLGTVKLGSLVNGGTPMILGPSANPFVPIQGVANNISIKRGRTRITDSFDSGTATITVLDRTGQFNPDNTSSNLYPYVLPMRQLRITATVNSQLVQLFNGFTTSYTYDYDPSNQVTYVTITAEDAFRVLNMAGIEIITGSVYGEKSGTRIGYILTGLAIPTTLKAISTGKSSLDLDDDTTRTALEAIQTIEATEGGAYFIDASGVHTFLDRHEVQKLASGVTVAPIVFNETSGLPYVGIEQSFDDQQVFNDITITGAGIGDQNVSDATSQLAYFKRSMTRSGSLSIDDTESLGQANLILNSRKDATLNIESITCLPLSMTSAQAYSVVNLDVLEPITVAKTYATQTVSRTLTAQSIEHSITPSSWQVSFGLSEPLGGDAFILDSTLMGLLDTNLLSY